MWRGWGAEWNCPSTLDKRSCYAIIIITITWHHSLSLLRGEKIFLNKIVGPEWYALCFIIPSFLKENNWYKFQQIYCKMWMKKMNKGNQIHNFKTVSVKTFVISFYYGSGFSSLRSVIKLRFWFRYVKKLRFLRFRFRNTACWSTSATDTVPVCDLPARTMASLLRTGSAGRWGEPGWELPSSW
jgi:hypothetical protein